jgi:hypothetical protein
MNTRRLTNLGLPGAALAAAALVLSGCKAKGATGGCDVVGACGGDPTGAWMVEPALSCTFQAVTRMAQNYANTAPYYEPESGALAPAVTSGAQCWDLSFDKDGSLATPKTPVPNPDYVISGVVNFFPDHSYTYGLTAVSTTDVHIARSCLGVNGANLGPNGTPTTCAILADKMNASIPASTTTYMSLDGTPSFRCVEGGDGCDCRFNFTETDTNSVGDKGTWAVEQGSSIIHHYSIAGQGNFYETNPARRTVRDATFCVSPDGKTLQLTGTNGTALALKAGTRSLTLSRIPPEPDAGAGGAGGAGGDTGAGGAGGTGGGGGTGGAGNGSDGSAQTVDADGTDGAVDAGDATAD